jgi:hypothetical protein
MLWSARLLPCGYHAANLYLDAGGTAVAATPMSTGLPPCGAAAKKVLVTVMMMVLV